MFMKKTLCLALLLSSFSSIAGDAFISKFTRASSGSWCVSVSNVGNVSADVTINAFLSNGLAYTGPSASDGIPSSFNSPFTLVPNRTSLLCVNNIPGPTEHGYARIVSRPTSGEIDHTTYLIATAYWVTPDKQMHIPVNDGLPF